MMAGKADFTEDEWNNLHRGATGAGMMVALSERGFSSTFKESGALAKFMAHASTSSTSQLVRELAATHGSGWKVSSSMEEVETGTVAALKDAVATLQNKANADLADYRTFVVEVAQAVAGAAKGGDVEEAAAIETIKAAMAD